MDGASDSLSLKVLTRIGTDGAGNFCGGHGNAVGLRLYFDSTDRLARFSYQATVIGYQLRSGIGVLAMPVLSRVEGPVRSCVEKQVQQATPTPTPTPSGELVSVTITYVYDSLYRLKEANYSDGRYFRYTYDEVGNRLTETKCVLLPCASPITTTYTYDDANRIATVNGVAYTFDANGNLKDDGASQYDYDSANRLTSVLNTQNSALSTFAYNGLGDRVSQTVNGQTTNYVLDLNAGLTQVLADGTNTYLYGAGRIGE